MVTATERSVQMVCSQVLGACAAFVSMCACTYVHTGVVIRAHECKYVCAWSCACAHSACSACTRVSCMHVCRDACPSAPLLLGRAWVLCLFQPRGSLGPPWRRGVEWQDAVWEPESLPELFPPQPQGWKTISTRQKPDSAAQLEKRVLGGGGGAEAWQLRSASGPGPPRVSPAPGLPVCHRRFGLWDPGPC